MNAETFANIVQDGAHSALPYRLRWRGSGARPGAHGGRLTGSGGSFRDFATLAEHPDARRVDLRMSLRDPFSRLYVRRFEQMSAVTVYAVADLSGSMAFEGRAGKMAQLAKLAIALAGSAHKSGDAFGFIGCDNEVRPDFLFPATRKRGLEIEIARRIFEFEPAGGGSAGLGLASRYLGGRRKLLFLISDFHMPLSEIEAVLHSLSLHDIVPVVMRDAAEREDLPAWGFVELRDLETGEKRVTLMRPSLRRAWVSEAETRAIALEELCLRYGRAPVYLIDRFSADKFGEQLMAR